MFAPTKIKSLATRYLLLFLILGQLSNAFLLSDFIVESDQIVLGSDMDNNPKEDKNNFDGEEEVKIFQTTSTKFTSLMLLGFIIFLFKISQMF